MTPKTIGSTLFIMMSLAAHSVFAQAIDFNSKTIQNKLNGAATIAASANYGYGIKFAVVDTGLNPSVMFRPDLNWTGIQNINTSGSAVCLNGRCTANNPITAPSDRQGHGTFVASEIVGGLPGYGYNGMASAGTVMGIKVFQDNGSGTSSDTALGIRYAADRGANVINLSLGPAGGNAAQQAAFYQSLASAVNYAATKNAYVVFAAGNANQMFSNGANITGFTDAALKRMLIVGSTDNNKVKSSFSNTAGSGSFYSTTGQRYYVSSLFITTAGENIYGANHSNAGSCAGYGCIRTMSGTSMAAPQGTAAIGLLEARWPVLKTNGNAAQIIRTTATDLGWGGIDATYGNGFLNMVRAFQPVGSLIAVASNGKNVAVSNISSSTITSGAFGSLASISGALKNFNTFDSYERNFAVDLSGLVAAKTSGSAATQTVTAPKTTSSAAKFANGDMVTFGQMAFNSNQALENVTNQDDDDAGGIFMAYTTKEGSHVATGRGFSVASSFANGLWGNNTVAAQQASQLGMANSVLGFADGGYFGSYGTAIDSKTRMAMSWSQTAETNKASDTNLATAAAYNVGLSRQINDAWQLGTSFGVLNEQDGMLGSAYANSPISFGSNHQTNVLNVASSLALSDNTNLLLDASMAKTNGADVTNSLVSSVSDVYSRSFGAALASRHVAKKNDSASLSLRAPLRVVSGHATMASNEVDEEGMLAAVTTQDYNLKPDGQEISLTLDYNAPITFKDQDNVMSWGVMLQARQDVGNVAGAKDVSGLANFNVKF